MEQKILVQVINLARRPDRLARITSDLRRVGIDFEIQVAVDGHLDSEEHHSPTLSKAEVGCWKSHLNAMRRLVETGGSYSLILEDDANPELIVTPKFLSRMANLMKTNSIDLLQIGFIGQYYEVSLKEGVFKYIIAFLKNIGKRDSSGVRFVVGDFRAGTHAYIVNTRLADLISKIGPDLPPRPWDGYLNSVAIGQAGISGRVARLRTSVFSQVSRQPNSVALDSDIAPE